MSEEIPGAFRPNQYENAENPRAHELTTGPEIWRQTAGRITHFAAGVGTGGTITGTGRYLKSQNPNVWVVGADPEGSIYTGDRARPYKVEGIGEDFMPGTFDSKVVDEWVMVTDRDSFDTARRITREEGILVGGSTGTAMWAALQVAKRLDEDKVILTIFPDTGRGYLSKVYNDAWMRENGFLDRLPINARVRDLVMKPSRELPKLVTVPANKTVREAIDLLQQYGISQLPVTRLGTGNNNGQGPFTDEILAMANEGWNSSWTKLDALHRMSLDTLLEKYNITQLTEAEKVQFNRVWHRGRPFVVEGKGENQYVDKPRWVSSKAAYAWYALFPSKYTWLGVQTVQPALRAGKGWDTGVYEKTNKPTGVMSLNTAAIILEASLYKKTGRPLVKI